MARYVTDKQRLVLTFIDEFAQQHGYAPSIRDVASRFDSSTKGAYDHVVALRKKGMIDYEPSRSRSAVVTRQGKHELGVSDTSDCKVPVIDRCAEITQTSLPFSDEWIYAQAPGLKPCLPNETRFAWRMNDDAMVNAGIRAGDILVLRRSLCSMNAFNSPGEIVLTLEEGRHALRFWFSQGGRAFLRAANPLYSDIFSANIVGRLLMIARVWDE